MKSAAVLLLLSIVAGISGAAADERNPTQLFDSGNQIDADGIVRDRDGRRIGQIEAEVGGSHVLRDNDGRHIGNVVRGFNEGELVIRDKDGRRKGTLRHQ